MEKNLLNKKNIAIGLVVIAVIIASKLTVLNNWPTGPPSVTGSAVGGSDYVKVPLSQLSGQAKFFEYSSGGATIRFFAVKASDGSIKTAFDACDVCFANKKGYRQEGDFMVCNNCGKRFAISSLGTENRNPGGCWPGYLASTANGGDLLIKKTDLEAGRYRFA